MVDRVILHVGMQKTGSTLIQKSLENYDDGVSYYGVFTAEGRDGPYQNHGFPIGLLFDQRNSLYHFHRRGLSHERLRSLRDSYLNDLHRQLGRRDRDTLIISGEDIGLMDEDAKLALLRIIESVTSNIEVICYVREPLSFAKSWFNQAIKNGAVSTPGRIKLEYRKNLQTFCEALGRERVHVRRFDAKSLKGGDVLVDFADLCGIRAPKGQTKETNASLSAPALKILYAFNRTIPNAHGDNLMNRIRQGATLRLQELYAGFRSPPIGLFGGITDQSEISYLSETFGIAFDGVEDSADKGPQLAPYMEDLADVDLTPLAECLSAPVHYREHIEWLCHRLFAQVAYDLDRAPKSSD